MIAVIYSDEDLAQVVHEANRALQVIQGDNAPSQPWYCEDPEIKRNVILGVRNARNGMTPAEHHQAWVDDKLAHGWRYGAEKDAERKTHPCLVAFGQLPRYQQDKNRLFIAIVRALWAGEMPDQRGVSVLPAAERGLAARQIAPRRRRRDGELLGDPLRGQARPGQLDGQGAALSRRQPYQRGQRAQRQGDRGQLVRRLGHGQPRRLRGQAVRDGLGRIRGDARGEPQ
jgi:hypothetical protein